MLRSRARASVSGGRPDRAWAGAHLSRARTASWLDVVGPLVFPLLVVVVGCVAASQGDQRMIGSWGLIQALPALYFISLALINMSFLLEVRRRRGWTRQPVLATHLVCLVVLLQGAPGLLEQMPRFATAWLHAGFTDQILSHHLSPGEVDARFNWPGFFGAAAAVTGAGGLDSAVSLLRWAPVFLVLLYLPPLFLIGRQLTGSTTAAWLGVWFFVMVNWVGQDYFGPQTLGFVMYLVAIALIVSFFREPRPGLIQEPMSTAWWSRLSAGRDLLPFDGLPDVPARPRMRAAVAVLLLLLTTALAVTHQLSPLMLVLAPGALVLVGRFRLTVFPVIAGVVALGWLSVGTTAYWVGHLDTIFGGVGNVQEVVANSVGERIGGSAGHLAVVKIRLAFTAVVWALMGASALLLWFRRHPPLTLFTLAVVPFLTLVQDYGDEGVLRIFLFSSPFASLLVGQALASMLGLRWVRAGVAAAALLLIPLFLTTRYGNESFEQVRADEVHAVRVLYGLARQRSILVSPTSQVPWRFAYVTQYDYNRPTHADEFLAARLGAVRYPVGSEARDAPGTYLIVTTSQITYAYEALGQPGNWFQRVRPLLTRANGYRLIFRNRNTWIYRYEAPR
jgi:hypothetical protein